MSWTLETHASVSVRGSTGPFYSTTSLLPSFTFTYIQFTYPYFFSSLLYMLSLFIFYSDCFEYKNALPYILHSLYIHFSILLHLFTMLSVILSEMHNIQLYTLFYGSKLLLYTYTFIFLIKFISFPVVFFCIYQPASWVYKSKSIIFTIFSYFPILYCQLQILCFSIWISHNLPKSMSIG